MSILGWAGSWPAEVQVWHIVVPHAMLTSCEAQLVCIGSNAENNGLQFIPDLENHPGWCQHALHQGYIFQHRKLISYHSPEIAPSDPGVAAVADADARRAAAAPSAFFSTWSRPPLSCATKPAVSSRVLDSRAEAISAARMRLVRSAFLQQCTAGVQSRWHFMSVDKCSNGRRSIE